MEHKIGIDHGTTFSVASSVKDGQILPTVVSLGQNEPQIPTVVYIDDAQAPPSVTVGTNAENRDALEPANVLKWYKPRMDTDPSFTFRDLTLTDITAHTLNSMKRDIERQINEPLDRALVTVPAWFHDHARKMTIEAAQRVGIQSVELENEPTAAAFFFHKRTPLQPGQIVLVYDLGGGTFDTSILEFRPDGKLAVLASKGDMNLGGHLWTLKLQEHVAPLYQNAHGIDLNDDPVNRYELYRACENCKRQLTQLSEARLIVKPQAGPRETFRITRELFDQLTRELLERTGKVMNQAIHDAGLNWDRITHVLLVGGTTRMRQVSGTDSQPGYIETVSRGKKPQLLDDRDQIVAHGAALLLQHLDRLPQPISLGNGSAQGSHADLDLDIIRTVPHNLSTWVRDRHQLRCAVLVQQGTVVPANGQRTFRRQRDKATEIEVPVFQGGTDAGAIDLAQSDWILMKKYRFHSIPDVPATDNEIAVTFEYDQRETIDVKAIFKPGTPEEKTLPGVVEDWKDLPEEIGQAIEIPLVVAIDCSGSMSGQKIKEAREQLVKVAEEYVGSGFTLSVVAFPHKIFSGAGVVLKNGTDVLSVRARVEDLMAGGGTPMAKGLEVADELMAEIGSEDSPRYIILITDGHPNDRNKTQTIGAKIREKGIKLFGIPIGGDADHGFIGQLCEKYEKIETAGGISKAFRNLLSG
jgi:molecular chaperone DnaK